MSGVFHSLKFHMHLSSDYYVPGSSVVKNMPAIAGDTKDVGSIPGSGRSTGGGHGNPFQYSCPENPMDRGAWWAYSPWGCKESDMTEGT